MPASWMLMVMLGTADAWYGGTRCLDPTGGGGDNCQNNECRISGPSRRRVSRVGAKFCLGGVYKNIWYSTTTTEAGCNASKLSNIAGSLKADFPMDWGSSAEEKKKQAGGLCSLSTNTHIGASMKHSCLGVADGSPPKTEYFSDTDCSSDNLTQTSSSYTGHQINGQPAPCFCNSDDSMYNPTSECKTCDTSELQCSDQERCTKAQKSKCSWSAGACACKNGNYEKRGVCVGGALHDVYFESSSYSACTAMTAGTYKKFPISSRRRGGTLCKSQSGSKWNGTDTVAYSSYIEVDCTGKSDGQPGNRTWFSNAGCTGPIYSEKQTIGADCSCMTSDDRIESECKSCGGLECSTQDSCLMGEGSCAWNNAASSDKCSCASQIYKSQKHCWDGLPHDIFYENVARSKCIQGDTASVHFKRLVDVSDESDWSQCRTNGDRSGNKQTATHYKERTCVGVANGKPPARAYYTDSACSNLLLKETNSNSDDTCECLKYNGCKPNTKFEKYYCTAADTATSKGQITAVEYSDGLCQSATGVNRTLTSVSDAVQPGVCSAWPPIALDPNFESNVILSCDAAGAPPKYKVWSRTNMDSMTPSCPSSGGDTGSVQDCYCVNELYFKDMAMEKNVQVAGDLTMTVSDVTAAIADTTFKKIVKSTIAETAGVAPTSIVNLELKAARRLQAMMNEVLHTAAAPRMLAEGSVKAEYLIVVPKVQETLVKNAVSNAATTAVSTKIQEKVSGSTLTFTATVTAKSAPTSAPATVAVTTDGAIAPQGVTASGTAVGAKTGTTSGSVYSHSTSALVLLMVAFVAAAFFE
mmetsp:Transcript_10615/g.19605  ORF Transcript_10615/g.19605 Transcript_10615/m.19605 type:complete len:810 (+) Transcript_10615:96-2525(+)